MKLASLETELILKARSEMDGHFFCFKIGVYRYNKLVEMTANMFFEALDFNILGTRKNGIESAQ